MSKQNEEKLRKTLQQAFPPLDTPELKDDLWPQMLKRLDESPIQASRWEWLLIALVLIWLLVFPGAIPALLYQL